MVLLVRMRLLYGAAAMSAGVFVFSYLQEREEREDQEQRAAEREVRSEHFFAAMEQLELSSQQRLEMRKFWRTVCNRCAQAAATGDAVGDASVTTTATAKVTVGDIQQLAHEYSRVFPDVFPAQHVLDATELAAVATQRAWSGLVESTSTMLLSTGKRLNDIAMDTKGGVELAVHRTARKYLEKALDVVADRLKRSLKDPHMPSYLKRNIDTAIEQFMPDVKVEIFRKTRALFRKSSSLTGDALQLHLQNGSTGRHGHSSGRSAMGCRDYELSIYQRVRAFILYHLFPFDKSIWMSLRDPYWVAFSCVGIFPVVGQVWWLILFILKDKTNEHQLCQFIIGFKVAQFISLGLVHSALGIATYVRCIVAGSLARCEHAGPSLEIWNAFFFVLQIALVWAAFFRLPYTHRPSERQSTGSLSLQRPVGAVGVRPPPLSPASPVRSPHHHHHRRVYHDAFGNVLHLDRGGYLMKFCGYETLAFVVIVVLVCIVLYCPFAPWQRKALFYWLRTAYGLVSLPFVAFKIPLLANVLMHTRRMGYNARGETVRAVTVRHALAQVE